MTTEDQITLVRNLLHDALDSADTKVAGAEEHRGRVIRFALYLVAREVLEGRVREIVWTEPPFPENEDHE